MSTTRQKLVAQYDIKETGLKNLIDDLCKQPECKENLQLIRNALNGIYSDFGSSEAMPGALLDVELRGAARIHAGYKALSIKQLQGKYEHEYGPEPSASHPTPKKARQHYQAQKQSFDDSLKFAFQLFAQDVEKRNQGKKAEEAPARETSQSQKRKR